MISVIFPTRKRPDWLERSVTSLVALADSQRGVEILVACDADDGETLSVRLPRLATWVSPERYGYAGTHHYMDALAAQAQGKWLMLWCDQAVMLTQGWDTVIEQQRPGVWFPDASPAYPFDITPAWPRAWFEITGRVAAYNHIDTYIQRLGETLGCHNMLPVKMMHNSVHTGIPADATYNEGRGLLGPFGMTGTFPQEALDTDAALIRTHGGI